MLSFLLQLLSGPIVGAVTGVINKHLERQMSRDVLQAELEKAVIGAITDVTKTQADVIKAEMQSESWIARNWRPISALGFVSVVLFYSLIVPIVVAWFNAPAPRIGDTLLLKVIELVTLCLGGYIGLRSLEKIAETVMNRWKR